MKSCEWCGEEIPYSKARYNAKFCKSGCCQEHHKKRYRDRNDKPYNVTKPTQGAISELKVTVDLLEKGWSVFRSVSPSAKCDLLAYKNGKSVRVEVKTGYYITGGALRWPPLRNNEFDVLAVVTYKELIYFPDSF